MANYPVISLLQSDALKTYLDELPGDRADVSAAMYVDELFRVAQKVQLGDPYMQQITDAKERLQVARRPSKKQKQK
jgi:hypothetical protein